MKMIVCLIGTLFNFKNIKYNILKKKKMVRNKYRYNFRLLNNDLKTIN